MSTQTHRSLPIQKGNNTYKIEIYTDTEPLEKTSNMAFHSKLIVSMNQIMVREPELFQPVLTAKQMDEAMENMKKWVDAHDQKTSNF